MQTAIFLRASDLKSRKRTAKAEGLPGTPAVDVLESITSEGIVCLFDGVKRRNLANHLRAKYMMTPEQYRTHWGLPDNYPMTLKAAMSKKADNWQRTTKTEGQD